MEFPPVLQIIIDERLYDCDSPRTLKDKLSAHDLDKELSHQADWTIEHFQYVDKLRGTAGLTVTPSGSLDPFSPVGKCFAESCTMETTDVFIKSVGLYTEQSALSDPLTSYFVEDRIRTDEYYDKLFRSLKIFHRLLPLIRSEVILFASPIHRYCGECKKHMESLLSQASERLMEIPQDYRAKVLHYPDGKYKLGFQIPVFQPDHDHPLYKFIDITKSDAALLARITSPKSASKASKRLFRSIVEKNLRSELQTVYFDLERSRELGSLMLSGSRSETLVISVLDDSGPKLSQLENWEKLRTVHLPWIADLTPDEVLILREEASTALPRLRELLRTQLLETGDQNNSVSKVIGELRAQALEVESELGALKLPKERNYRAGMLGLAMAFVIYGIASQSPPLAGTSIAALLATLGHLRSTEREHDKEQTKLVSAPAYALLKAKEIVSTR